VKIVHQKIQERLTLKVSNSKLVILELSEKSAFRERSFSNILEPLKEIN